MRKSKYIVFIIALALFVSCTEMKYYSDKSNPIVAQIGDKKLYYKDIDVAYKNKSIDVDSVSAANSYISHWIKTQLKLNESEKLFVNDNSDIEFLVDRYRKMLLLTKFENYYGSLVDTIIEQSEINKYYNANKYQFKLTSPIVKARLLILPLKYEHEKMLTKKLFSRSIDDYYDLLSISERDNLQFLNFDDDWKYFSEVIRYFPYNIRIPYDNFILKNKISTAVEDGKVYRVYIPEYRLSGEEMPLSFVYNDVKKAILNKRRGDIYRKIEDSVYYNEIQSNKVYQLTVDSILINEINNEKIN